MKNKLSLILFVLYKYFDKRKDKIIAYETGVIVFILLILFTYSIIAYFFPYLPKIVPDYSEQKFNRYLRIGSVFLGLYIITMAFFKKENIVALQFDKTSIDRTKAALILYIIFLALIFLLGVLLKGLGVIHA